MKVGVRGDLETKSGWPRAGRSIRHHTVGAPATVLPALLLAACALLAGAAPQTSHAPDFAPLPRRALAAAANDTICNPAAAECLCTTCAAFRQCLQGGFCSRHRRDPVSNGLVPASTDSGLCYQELTAWSCSVVADARAASGLAKVDVSTSWRCAEPDECRTPAAPGPDEWNNGPTVALGFAIAGAAVLSLCCTLALCAYFIAGKNAVVRMAGGGGRGAHYAVDPPKDAPRG